LSVLWNVSFSVLISFASLRWWLACTGTLLILFEAKVLSPECRFYLIAGIRCCLSLFAFWNWQLIFVRLYFLIFTFRFGIVIWNCFLNHLLLTCYSLKFGINNYFNKKWCGVKLGRELFVWTSWVDKL
jgi:hypothetical protein